MGEKALKHSYYLITPGWRVEADEHMDQLVQSGEEFRGPNKKTTRSDREAFNQGERRALEGGREPQLLLHNRPSLRLGGVEACHRVTSTRP